MKDIKYIYKVGGDEFRLTYAQHVAAVEEMKKGGQMLFLDGGNMIINIRNINSAKLDAESVEIQARATLGTSWTRDELREASRAVRAQLSGAADSKKLT